MPGCFSCVSPVIPAAHPSVPRSLSPAPIGERESIPPLTRLSREVCPRPRPGSGNPSCHSPIFPAKACPRPRAGSGSPSRRSPVFPAKLVPGPDRGAGVHPAAHPSFPRSLSPAPIGEWESIPPLTRLSHEACPRPRPGSGSPSRRSPVFPAKLVPGPDRGAGVHPAAHPSFPPSLSPAPTGERESIPPLTRHSHEACPRLRPGSGNPSRRSPVIPVKTGIHALWTAIGPAQSAWENRSRRQN